MSAERAKQRWRVLAQDGATRVELEDRGVFDELVIDDWLHLEQMEERVWWMRLGDARIVVSLEHGITRVDVERGAYEDITGATTGYNRAAREASELGGFLVDPKLRPSWLEYPRAYRRLIDQGLLHPVPWHLMEAGQALRQANGLALRYPARELFPFAFRQDNDDVACWAHGHGERVFVVHDFATPGVENEAEFADVWAWFRAAIDETVAWD